MIDIAAIKARADKATAGPWAVEDPLDIPSVIADGHKQVYDWVMIAHIDTGKTKRSVKADRNADFIAHARTDIPGLLAALEASEAARVKAEQERDALKAENHRLSAGLIILSTSFYKGDQHQAYAKHILEAKP